MYGIKINFFCQMTFQVVEGERRGEGEKCIKDKGQKTTLIFSQLEFFVLDECRSSPSKFEHAWYIYTHTHTHIMVKWMLTKFPRIFILYRDKSWKRIQIIFQTWFYPFLKDLNVNWKKVLCKYSFCCMHFIHFIYFIHFRVIHTI